MKHSLYSFVAIFSLIGLTACTPPNTKMVASEMNGGFFGTLTPTSGPSICKEAVVELEVNEGYFEGTVKRGTPDMVSITPIVHFSGYIFTDGKLKVLVHPRSQVRGEAKAQLENNVITGTWSDEYDCRGDLELTLKSS
ncbi:hypothetical protein [Curvivirga sp.]|uniref:hypothetical protein n=1 Tax=Curvivirga sp. TaxID=2856848 RepID=UPI003B5BE4D2